MRGEGGDDGAGGKVGAGMGKQGSEGKAALDRETDQYVTGKSQKPFHVKCMS